MKISAVIPAYNEAATIVPIVKKLNQHKKIAEVIVVDDGSKDDTAKLAKKEGAKIISSVVNQGKGAAIAKGIKAANTEWLLLLDADLLGLRSDHIDILISPILNKEAEMTVGIFKSGRLSTDLAHKIAPFLSGQRVIKRELMLKIKNLKATAYGLEVAITESARSLDLKVKKVYLNNLSHKMKEEKLGLLQGGLMRFKMYLDIIKIIFKK